MTSVEGAAAPTVEPLNVARVLRDGIGVFRRRGLALMAIALVLNSLPELLAGQLLIKLQVTNGWYLFANATLGLTTGLVAEVAMIRVAMGQLAGERLSIGRSLLQSLRLWPAAFGIALLVRAALLLGLLFLIVPGLIVIVTCFVVLPYRIVNGPGVMDAIKGSTELSKGSRWAISGLVLVVWFGVLAAYGVMWLAARAAGAVPDGLGASAYGWVLSPLYNALVAAVAAVFPAAAFHELTHRGRLDVNRAAEVFA